MYLKMMKGKYFMRDIISYIGIDQSRIVKAEKNYLKKGYLKINVETHTHKEM